MFHNLKRYLDLRDWWSLTLFLEKKSVWASWSTSTKHQKLTESFFYKSSNNFECFTLVFRVPHVWITQNKKSKCKKGYQYLVAQMVYNNLSELHDLLTKSQGEEGKGVHEFTESNPGFLCLNHIQGLSLLSAVYLSCSLQRINIYFLQIYFRNHSKVWLHLMLSLTSMVKLRAVVHLSWQPKSGRWSC